VAVPKKKMSKSRVRRRRSHDHLKPVGVVIFEDGVRDTGAPAALVASDTADDPSFHYGVCRCGIPHHA
jgi:hypothetical protein